MAKLQEGGCVCGGVRYRVSGLPKRVSACCCRWCQRRTGSILAVSVYLDERDIEVLSGETRSCRLTSDAGRWIEPQFCLICGTTVFWHLEFLPSLRGVAGGTFDDPSFWALPERLVFARTKPEWLTLSEHITEFQAMPE